MRVPTGRGTAPDRADGPGLFAPQWGDNQWKAMDLLSVVGDIGVPRTRRRGTGTGCRRRGTGVAPLSPTFRALGLEGSMLLGVDSGGVSQDAVDVGVLTGVHSAGLADDPGGTGGRLVGAAPRTDRIRGWDVRRRGWDVRRRGGRQHEVGGVVPALIAGTASAPLDRRPGASLCRACRPGHLAVTADDVNH